MKQDDTDEATSVLPMVKRQKLGAKYIEPKVDEQAISESSLNKLVGAADMYNLEVSTLLNAISNCNTDGNWG